MITRSFRTVCLVTLIAASLIGAFFEAQAVYSPNGVYVGSSLEDPAASGSPTYVVAANPSRLQEGFNTTISVEARDEIANTTLTINVTDPSGTTYTKMLSITINGTGFGSNSTQYWSNFAGGANTKYIGAYTIAVNGTLANANFAVGLTGKSEYKRTETVFIRAVGYLPRENVTISLKIGNTSIAGFPKTLSASNDGVISDTWSIPSDATPGTYQIQLLSIANQTVKTPADQGMFTVLGAICSVKTENRANQTVANVVVEVYNATSNAYLNLAGTTNSSGWILFKLDHGNYTFKAFFRNVQVGSLQNRSVTMDATFLIQLRLVNIVVTAETEAGDRVQSIKVDLIYNYMTRENKSLAQTDSVITNTTGMAEFLNRFTNITYRVNARRYDMLFLDTTETVDFSPMTPWISLELTLPNNRLNLRVLDSKGAPAVGVLVKIYEFSAVVTEAPLQSFEIDSSGSASPTFPFGMYRLRAFAGDMFLNETVVVLAHDPVEFEFDLETASLDVTVSVYDYFGNPISNAQVKIERPSDSQYILVADKLTGADGSVTFDSLVGGNSLISIYVAGKPAAIATEFLASGSNKVAFRLGEYIAFFGFTIETGVFALVSFIVVLILAFLVLMRGRLTQIFRRR